MKKKRIRIHKQTLRLLDNPGYIQLLVNPEQKTIAIKVCNASAQQVHKILYKPSVECDLYSKELMYQLNTVCPELISGYTYRLFGKLLPEKGVALFQMTELFPVAELSGNNNKLKDGGYA